MAFTFKRFRPENDHYEGRSFEHPSVAPQRIMSPSPEWQSQPDYSLHSYTCCAGVPSLVRPTPRLAVRSTCRSSSALHLTMDPNKAPQIGSLFHHSEGLSPFSTFVKPSSSLLLRPCIFTMPLKLDLLNNNKNVDKNNNHGWQPAHLESGDTIEDEDSNEDDDDEWEEEPIHFFDLIKRGAYAHRPAPNHGQTAPPSSGLLFRASGSHEGCNPLYSPPDSLLSFSLNNNKLGPFLPASHA